MPRKPAKKPAKAKAPKAAKPTGRPSLCTPVLCERIVRKLSEGASFRWFDTDEARAEGFPATASIRRWRIEDAAFDAECARACEASADADYDRMEELEARALLPDKDPEHLPAQAASVVLSNMRWRMEKRKGRTYGQKVEVKAALTLEQLVGASLDPAE